MYSQTGGGGGGMYNQGGMFGQQAGSGAGGAGGSGGMYSQGGMWGGGPTSHSPTGAPMGAAPTAHHAPPAAAPSSGMGMGMGMGADPMAAQLGQLSNFVTNPMFSSMAANVADWDNKKQQVCVALRSGSN